LYRGSRDGFTTTAFHKNVGSVKPTITLVESNLKKIFGGFTDQNWEVTSNYKQTTNAFLFSVTDKEKYNLKSSGSSQATFSNANYLPTFGGGHDFHLSQNGNQNSTNYCNFGHSYETNGKVKEDLAGAYNFQIKDLEVFQVEYTGTLLIETGNKKKKSKGKN